MVASSSPLDQFVIQHPDYFFNKSPETARINPDNLVILVDHLKCAAFEIPFKEGEEFGAAEVTEILEYLAEEHVLHKNKDTWHWMNDAFPAHEISLVCFAGECGHYRPNKSKSAGYRRNGSILSDDSST